MIEGFATVRDMAEKWGVTVRTVRTMCSEGKIEGATKFGDVWAIPSDARKPTDKRVVSGKYKDWRKKFQNPNRMTYSVYVLCYNWS